MENLAAFIFWPFCLILALITLLSARRAFKTWKLIRDLPTIPISSVTEGIAEIQGKARDEQHGFVSPISGEPCVYYHIAIERQSGQSWKALHEKSSNLPITIDDGTGKAHIPLGDAAIDFNLDLEVRVGSWYAKEEQFPQVIEDYINSLDLKKNALGLERNLRCLETYIAPGDELYVLGYGVTDGAAVTFTRKKPHPFIVSDRYEEEVARTYYYAWLGYALVGGTLLLILLAGAVKFFIG